MVGGTEIARAIEQLGESWRKLDGTWSSVSQTWRDSRAREFEAAHLAPIGAQLVPTQKTLEELSRVITGARANVS